MSEYDIEQVKKFAQANKDKIEQAKKNYPEVGGLIEEILNSIIDEEPAKMPTASITKTSLGVNINGVAWIPLQIAETIKPMIKDLVLEEKVFRTRKWITLSPENVKFSEEEKRDAISGMLLTGHFYELLDDVHNIEEYERIYNTKYKATDKAVLFMFKDDYKELFPATLAIATFDKTEKFQEMPQYFTQKALAFVNKSNEQRIKLGIDVSNVMISNFLELEAANGFFDKKSNRWWIPAEISKTRVAIDDFNGEIKVIKKEDLFDELGDFGGQRLIPARKPKFKVGEEVYIPYNDQEGKIGGYKYDEKEEAYSYLIELPSKQSFYATEDSVALAKSKPSAPPTAKTPTARKPKTPAPTPAPTPVSAEEKEISEMTQSELKQLKTDIEETLPFLDEGDAEKKELEIQLELVNLYLEN